MMVMKDNFKLSSFLSRLLSRCQKTPYESKRILVKPYAAKLLVSPLVLFWTIYLLSAITGVMVITMFVLPGR